MSFGLKIVEIIEINNHQITYITQQMIKEFIPLLGYIS